MRLTIVGGGYVGLVSGACLAELGHNVIIVEQDLSKVQKINLGHCPIHEAGLEPLLRNNIGKRLSATDELEDAMSISDATFIAVGTPFNGQNIDLTAIDAAARNIGQALRNVDGYHLVVVKSTVVPGTTDDTVARTIEKESGKSLGTDFGIGMNPEFLREGSAVDDFMHPDRIVMGGNDRKARSQLARIYDCFKHTDKLEVNNTTAEMIKYASNSLLATLISFSNEIGNLCAAFDGVDAQDVMHAVCKDKRISPITEDHKRIIPGITSYLAAGCGFGGSCFPKDVKALRAHAQSMDIDSHMLDAVIRTNEAQPVKFVDILLDEIPDLASSTVSVLGLAFKPDTDDTRESPAVIAIQRLIALGVNVKVFDPVVTELPDAIKRCNITVTASLSDCVQNSDAILIMTAWNDFKAVPETLRAQNANPLVLDGRRLLKPEDCSRYRAIGLGSRESENKLTTRPSDDQSSAA